MKFSNIFGNPPFQDSVSKKKTQHKIWIDFTTKAINEWLEDGGNLGWITPQSWGSPSNKVLNILKKYNVPYLNMDTKQYFQDVGSTFSHFLVQKKQRHQDTIVVNKQNKSKLNFSESTLWVPNDFCELSMNIHNKVMFETKNKFKVNWDYVTCHNVIRHAQTLKNRKLLNLEERIKNCTDTKILERLKKTRDALLIKNVDISVSETRTDTHIYPIFHTNSKVWFSSKKQDFASMKKVMWSRSGHVKAFYDPGNLGCTDMGYYILVDSDEQGRRLEKFLNSYLMQYIFTTAKWCGFGNEIVFSSIPQIPLNLNMSEEQLYKFFNLTEDEKDYINQKQKIKTKKTKSETISTERVKQYGEVFTPKELVLSILDLVDSRVWQDPKETFIDPSCGNGNFLVEIVRKRLCNKIPTVCALQTLYGVDIQEDNIIEAKKRIINVVLELDSTMKLETIQGIVDRNIICLDSLNSDLGKQLTKYC